MLAGLTGSAILSALPARAAASKPSHSPVMLDAVADFGLVNGDPADQTKALEAALKAAADQGRILMIPAGGYVVSDVEIPADVQVMGVRGQTIFTTPGDKRLAHIVGPGTVTIDGIVFQANAPETAAGVQGLIEIDGGADVSFCGCAFLNAAGNGISAGESTLSIEDCDFAGFQAAAIHAQNGVGLMVRGNRISDCDNAGIRIWRDDDGPDGAIVTGNRIGNVRWADGGNGQNGNGVSIYKADNVIVSDNVIENCAFSAVRVNSGRDTQIRGNTCLNSGEVAIFSEFAFSGSVIADNIIDGAATGISITNLDNDGHLATCTGNIVRNIAPLSENNPDTRPVGIYAEAETVVANNSIENVPGIGILAGYGPYVRNIIVSDNVLSQVQTGIATSVVQDPKAGAVRISGNIIGAGAANGIVGMEWDKVVAADLTRPGGTYPNVVVVDNTVG